MALVIGFPDATEYAEFQRGYIAAVIGEPDALPVLERQRRVIDALGRLTPEQAAHRYADGKWSVREIVGHLSDTERILAYRLLCIARGDKTPLPGFDEEAYGAETNADRRTLGDLVEELAIVRLSTLALVRSLDDSFLTRRGTVRDWTLSVRALAFVIAGHFEHHVNVLRDRYGIVL
ncbi:MAG TPA: DinB family protein [Vicinamibacterales bacterium]|nr:DinB family protein [Vicinamibacterales bacterium]